MTTFVDGPAQFAKLLLRRSPFLLRVVRKNVRPLVFAIDALDEADDEPKDDEEIFVYRRLGEPGYCHIKMKDGGGFYPLAIYELVPAQPPFEILRSNSAWRQWCLDNAARLGFNSDATKGRGDRNPRTIDETKSEGKT